MHVFVKKLAGSSLLPWCKSPLGRPCCFLEYAVLLDKMRSQDKAELIQSQPRETVAPPKERKDAFGNLGYNQIVFEHCHAIVTDLAKTKIFNNVI